MTTEQFLDRLRSQRGQFFVSNSNGWIRHVSLKDSGGRCACPITAQPECCGVSNFIAPIVGRSILKLDFPEGIVAAADSKKSDLRKPLLEALGLEEVQ